MIVISLPDLQIIKTSRIILFISLRLISVNTYLIWFASVNLLLYLHHGREVVEMGGLHNKCCRYPLMYYLAWNNFTEGRRMNVCWMLNTSTNNGSCLPYLNDSVPVAANCLLINLYIFVSVTCIQPSRFLFENRNIFPP